MEIYGQVDSTAWDSRLIQLLVKSDLRRDFFDILALNHLGENGTLFFGPTPNWTENHVNRLTSLKKAIEKLREMLLFNSEVSEKVFHDFIAKNPILLDVYGECESKPRFQYPEGETSIIGKITSNQTLLFATQIKAISSRQRAFPGLQDQKQYIELIMEQFKVDEVLTFDDLLERACSAYYQLTGLLPW